MSGSRAWDGRRRAKEDKLGQLQKSNNKNDIIRKKQLWDIYTMEYCSAVKKEENFTLCNSMDEPGEHYAK